MSIVRALALLSAAACPVAAQNSWVTFSDPREQSFTVEVPKGWNVQGGLDRRGILDPRMGIQATSPDGAITYRLGDTSIPPYTVPTPIMGPIGLHEGSPYSPDGKTQGAIGAYRTGPEFARQYVQTRFIRLCRNLQVKAVRQAPPTLRYTVARSSAGEVSFTCQGNNGSMAGYVYAQTVLFGDSRTGLWIVPALSAFLAPEPQWRRALQVMFHSAITFRINERWARTQNMAIPAANAQSEREADVGLQLSRDFGAVIRGDVR